MSLTALPVTSTDLQNLEMGIVRVKNPTEAAAEAILINAGATTVAAYTAQLDAQMTAYTQVIEGVIQTMDGVTGTSAQLGGPMLTQAFAQVTRAIALGLNPVVLSAEAAGLAWATSGGAGGVADPVFSANFGPANVGMPNTAVGDQAASVAIVNAVFGVSATAVLNAAVNTYIINWKAFYTANPTALGAGTITAAQIDLAARGAAMGDAVGLAINSAVGPLGASVVNVLNNDALFENGQAPTAYGVGITTVPTAAVFQGGVQTSNLFTLTTGIDGPTGFTATALGAVYNAVPFFGGNTLTILDNLQDPFLDGVLNFVSTIGGATATPLVTLNGISTLNYTGGTGFTNTVTGAITGLTIVNMNNSVPGGNLVLGAAGQGLNTKLANVNFNTTTGTLTATMASAALAGTTDTLTVALNGPTTGQANTLTIGNDGSGGASVYETLSVTTGNAATLAFTAGGTSLNTLTLKGTGTLGVTNPSAGSMVNLKTIDATGNSGGVTIGNDVIAATTVLTSLKGGSGADSFDLSASGMTAVQIATMAADGGGARDTLILSAAQASSVTALADVNFEIISTGDLAGAAVNAGNLGVNVDTLTFTLAQTAATTLTNAPTGFTLNDVGSGAFLTTIGGNAAVATGTTDVFNLNTTATLASVTETNFENLIITTKSGATGITLGTITETASPGAGTTLTLVDSNTTGTIGITATNASVIKISGTGTGSITITGDISAASLDASGETGLTGANGVIMSGKALVATSLLGSGGADTLTGSAFADVISGGAGNDTIANEATGFAATAADSLTGGTGFNGFILRGDVAASGATTVTASLAASPNVTDFKVGLLTTNTDFIEFSATAANYSNAVAGGSVFFAGVAAAGAGATAVQTVLANVAAQAIVAGTDMLKLGAFTEVPGTTTLQTAFNTAIGTGTVTGLTAKDAIPFSMYDTTIGQAIFGIVNATAGTNTIVESGDTVTIVGHMLMTATDYANLSNNSLVIVAA